MKLTTICPLAFLVACGTPSGPAAQPEPAPARQGPPPARVDVVVDDAFGVPLEDPYRWMESAEHADELRAWLIAQGRYTRAQLDATPGLAGLRTRVRELNLDGDVTYAVELRGARRFYMRTVSGEPIARLHVEDPGAPPRVLVDPVALTGGAAAAAINTYKASPDGSRVAFNVSTGGSEITRVRVIDVASGTIAPDVLPNVWGEFDVHWLPDGKSFFYTQMSAANMNDPSRDRIQGMAVRHHVLGADPATDRTVLGPDVAGPMAIDPKEFPIVTVPPGSRWALAMAVGARPEMRLAIAPVDALASDPIPWRPVADYADRISQAQILGDRMFVLSSNGNGAVLELDARAPVLANARVVVPAGDHVLEEIAAARDGLYVRSRADGDAALRRLGLDGALTDVPLPVARAGYLVAADARRDGLWIALRGYDRATEYLAVANGALAPTGLANQTTVDFSNIEVVRATAPSTGGVSVPMTILRRRGLPRDGKRPTLLVGYGGYGITITPSYAPTRMAWLERGGQYAVCNVRGGGARGNDWHQAGRGANKPNGVRDFVACARTLAASGYTSAAHIGGMGGSMGGVLVGRAITESPEAFGAAILSVPFVNAVRYLAAQNGANQSAELGATPDSAEGLRTLLAMDVVHNVEAGVAYPPTLVQIGLNDQRVAPWMGAKLAARMQASHPSGVTLIRTSAEEGHGVGSTRDQEADETADFYGFLLAQLGHPDFAADAR